MAYGTNKKCRLRQQQRVSEGIDTFREALTFCVQVVALNLGDVFSILGQ